MLSTIVKLFLLWIARLVLMLRYRVKVTGLETMPEKLSKKGGVLFLPNHPTFGIDPVLIEILFWPKYRMRYLTAAQYYYVKSIYPFLKFLKSIPVPNFDIISNSFKIKKTKIFSKSSKKVYKTKKILFYIRLDIAKRLVKTILEGHQEFIVSFKNTLKLTSY